MTIEQILSFDTDENEELGVAGLSILVVDCSSTCLTIVSRMLIKFGYKVMTAKRATDALHILQEKQEDVDLILTEVHLPDMDKYELLETMGETSSLPIVFMSADDSENAMLGCLFKGAAFYLVKPITMNDIKNLWQFSYMNKQEENFLTEGAMSFKGDSPPENGSNEVSECLSFVDSGDRSVYRGKRKEFDERDQYKEEENPNSIISKKPKLIWTNELHERFLQAIRILGIDCAHPKKILKHMNIPGLKKENISSHLQKYRLALKREQDAIQKTMFRDYQLPSSFNLQAENFHFLKPQILMTNYAENQKFINASICSNVSSLSSSNYQKNNISNPKYKQYPQVNGAHTSSTVADINVLQSNEEFKSFGLMENEMGLKRNSAESNMGYSGFESGTDGIEVSGNSSQQQQQQQLSSSLPLLWEQVEDYIFESEVDETLDMEKGSSTQLFIDEDLW